MSKNLFEGFPPVSSKQWKQKIQADLKGADYTENLVTKTDDDIAIRPFYHRDEMPTRTLKAPDEGKEWSLCEKIYVAAQKASVEKIKKLLSRGAESLWLTIDSEKIDLISILKEIDLEKFPVFVEFDPRSYLADKENSGDFLSKAYFSKINQFLNGKKHQISFGIDPIGHLARSGNWYKNLQSDHEILEGILSEKPSYPLLSIDVSLYQNAGANIPQQIAYAVAHANEHLNHFSEKNDLGRLTFKVSVGSNYFFEIAKLKALRVVYAAVAAQYGLSENIKILAFPSKRNKSLYDYNMNMLRTTTECMAAILGGANEICNAAYDEIYHKENEFGNRIARNQLLILKNEAYIKSSASGEKHSSNPAEGSYYLESLAQQFSEKALGILKDIEESGGFLKQLKEGTIQRKIRESAEKEQNDFEDGKHVLIGTNKFQNPQDQMKNELELYPFLKHNPRKTLIEPILEKRLAEGMEKNRIENE